MIFTNERGRRAAQPRTVVLDDDDETALLDARSDLDGSTSGDGRQPVAHRVFHQRLEDQTGHADPADRARVLRAGFQAHLPKRALPEGLIGTVASLATRAVGMGGAPS